VHELGNLKYGKAKNYMQTTFRPLLVFSEWDKSENSRYMLTVHPVCLL